MDPATTSGRLLDAVRALAPSIAARSDEIERGRRLPPDLVAELAGAGCFRMLVPRSHGGDDVALPERVRVLEELARADGSTGWSVMIGSAAPELLALLPRASFEAIYAGGPDVIAAGAFNPTGTATPQADGYRVTGQWAFASGCEHAHWFVAHCLVTDSGGPPVRMMVLPARDVDIKDTWSVSGLAGTGSHDFVVNDVFVPGDRSFALDGEACVDGPLHRIPELSYSALGIAAVAVGIAQGAVDDILSLATAKVPAFTEATLASNPLFQNRYGEIDARLQAARALLDASAGRAWAQAVARDTFTVTDRARIRGAAAWITRAAASVVDVAYTSGGGTANHLTSPLQRRLRDVHAVTQHFAVKPDTFTLAGAVLGGQDVDTAFL
jgi:alkylation response protein AidB-like acyl-CoA dehydrogenase